MISYLKGLLLKVPLLILLCLAITSCKDEYLETRKKAYSFYQVGMFDAVLTLGEGSQVYKGMIYEYGLTGDVDLNKAKEYYSKIRDKEVSNKRLFMLCYIYCTKSLESYYKEASNGYGVVQILYAIELVRVGVNCFDKADKKACELAYKMKKEFGGDFVYQMAVGVNNKLIKDKNARKDTEIVYYLLKKLSFLEGNERASSYMAQIPSSFYWIPKKAI